MSKKISVLGSGSWGTALANHLSLSGHDVSIWGLVASDLDSINQKNLNPTYFPDVILSKSLKAEADIKKAVSGAELIVFSVPSGAMRDVAEQVKGDISKKALIVNTAKGLEANTLKRMSEVLEESCSNVSGVATLSGPSFAYEVIRNQPTAVTVASKAQSVADEVASIFHNRHFRVYTSTDVVGVDLGGALKNVVALAVGISDGKNLGDNCRAALITRGLAEMSRLIVALGGQEHTVLGLSVLGDLLLTCTGDLSRNRQVGLALGRGEKLEQILSDLGQVAEGVKTTPKVLELGTKNGVDMPITEELNAILAGKHDVNTALEALLSRVAGPE